MEVVTSGSSKVAISRNAKGDLSYELTLYFSAKGRAPEAGIARADALRRDLERLLGISDEVPFDADVKGIMEAAHRVAPEKGEKTK